MKFNQSTVGINQTQTYEGGKAYKVPQKELLIRQALTSFVEPKFYEKSNEAREEILKSFFNILNSDPQFVANLIVYARKEFHLRSVSHMLAAELAYAYKGGLARKVINEICLRPDDMTEILSYYLQFYGKPIPNAMKKGLTDALKKFDEYQLAKYKGNRKKVSIKDVIKLTHPIPTSANYATLWGKVIDDTLETPYTWETELSAKGNTTEVWEELIESGQVGYMALLRNLRNIAKAQPKNIQKVVDIIKNEERVRNSKQLPFRFFSAYLMLVQEQKHNPSIAFSLIPLIQAVETACAYSVQNMPTFQGRTYVVADGSGSMFYPLSQNSSLMSADIAALLLSMAHSICEQSLTATFSEELRHISINSNNELLYNTQKTKECFEGFGTNTALPIRHLLDNNIVVDRVILISDDQGSGFIGDEQRPFWQQYSMENAMKVWQEYKSRINPNAYLHVIDTQGYNTQQFIGDKISYTPGWSDKVFEFIHLIENDTSNLIETIKKYKY